jgi:uncharacterized membrane protein YedE/YeeE
MLNLSSTASAPPLRVPDRLPLLAVSATSILAFIAISQAINLRQGGLFLIGMALGITLLHAAFGFTGGWKRMVLEQRSRAMRAQLLMVGVAALAFFPLLGASTIEGKALVGALAPVGVAVAAGAAMFGVGMQLAGGCGSGTLFTVGGGSKRMLVTLLFFVIGALLGTLQLGWWLSLPSLPAISLVNSMGAGYGLIVTLVGLALVYGFVRAREHRQHGSVEPLSQLPERAKGLSGWQLAIFGPWSLLVGALALAALNILTLLVAGHPWSITYAFGLWGAKAAQAIGFDVQQWSFWQAPYNARALQDSVLADVTSVMNFGLLLGSALAATLAGRFALAQPLAWKDYSAAIIGGLLMGYGARVSFGCNVGALFSGIASGSLHGWLWFACAFLGSWLFLRMTRTASTTGVQQ